MIELSPRLEMPSHVSDFRRGISQDLGVFAGDIVRQSQQGPVFVHNPVILPDLSLLGQTLASIRQGKENVRLHAVLTAADASWFGKYSHGHNLDVFSFFDSALGQLTPDIHTKNVAKAMRDKSSQHICFVIGRTHDVRARIVDNMGDIVKSSNQVAYPSHVSQDAMLWLAQESGFPLGDIQTISDHPRELRALRHLPLIDTYYRYNISGGDVLGRLGSVCSHGTKYCLDDLYMRLSVHLPDAVHRGLGGSSEDVKRTIRFVEGEAGHTMPKFNRLVEQYGRYN